MCSMPFFSHRIYKNWLASRSYSRLVNNNGLKPARTLDFDYHYGLQRARTL